MATRFHARATGWSGRLDPQSKWTSTRPSRLRLSLDAVKAMRDTSKTVRWPEVDWYEAAGVGRKEIRVKRFLDE